MRVDIGCICAQDDTTIKILNMQSISGKGFQGKNTRNSKNGEIFRFL
jgi:hypothetical protein